MKEEIARRLRKAREAANFRSATAAAESLGIPYPTYAGHENGSRGLEVEAAIHYARRFRVSLDWLLAGNGHGPGELDALWEMFSRLQETDVPERVRAQVIAYAQGRLDQLQARTKDTAATPAS